MASLSLSHRTFRKSHVSVSGVFKDVSASISTNALDNPDVSVIALKADGSVIVWGEDKTSSTGTIVTPTVPREATSDVISIASGSRFNIALKSNGTVIGWGLNDRGQTNIPAGLSNVIAIAAGSTHSLALKSDGTVVIWGMFETGPTTFVAPTIPTQVSSAKITAISCGVGYCLALTDQGQVLAWGARNDFNQTTLPSTVASDIIKISAGAYHCLALKSNGSVINWGRTDNNLSPAPATTASDIIDIAAGGLHSLALKSNGSVIVWGNNTYSQLTLPTDAGSKIVKIMAAAYHSIAMTSDGKIVGWGRNAFYESQSPPAFIRTIPAKSLTHSSTVVIAPWYLNSDGTPSTSSKAIQSPAGSGIIKALGITQMGTTASGISLTTNGAVLGWGSNQGLSSSLTVSPTVGAAIKQIAVGHNWYNCLNSSGAAIAGSGDNTNGQLTIQSTATSQVKSLVGGFRHCLALKSNGTVVGWGQNLYQECTPPPTLTNAIAIAAGSYFSLALTSSGSVIGWGIPTTGQINIPSNCSSGVKAIAVGHNSCMALKDNGTIVGWGIGWSTPPSLVFSGVIDISCQGQTNIALLSDGTVVSWNANTTVQNITYNVYSIGLPSYQWKIDGVDVAGATQSSYTAPNLITGIVCSINSAGTFFNLPASATPKISLSYTPRYKEGNPTTMLIDHVMGAGAITFQWFKNDIAIPNETTLTLTLTASSATTGVYHCVATNTYGTDSTQKQYFGP